MGERTGKAVILVVDDAVDTVEVLRRNLQGRGFAVLTAGSVGEAVGVLGQHAVDLVVTDMRMPGGSGLAVIRHVSENLPDTEVLVITGYATVEGAVEALKAGAENYLAKPFTDGELFAAVDAAFAKLGVRRAGREADAAAARARWGLVGACEAMRGVAGALDRLAASTRPVLVSGEAGTGRRHVARALHRAAGSGAGVFAELGAATATPNEVERELRGEGGAPALLTGVGGTLYVADVTEIPLELQERLLGIGEGGHPRQDARLVVSTSMPVPTAVAAGLLHPSWQRRAVALPPLRERGDDVIVLAWHFLTEATTRGATAVPELDEAALRLVRSYAWPGNVRELRDLMQSLVAARKPRVGVRDLPAAMRYSARGDADASRSLAEVEWEHLQAVMAEAGGNKSRAADILGIDRKTLREKLRRTPRTSPS
ncbi:MAG: response regulator [Thermoanaerobaculaceae bacterium]|nr:response regulator [Thermoanaerobaculaceae bacterium]